MNNRKYYIKAGIITVFVMPIIVTLSVIAGAFLTGVLETYVDWYWDTLFCLLTIILAAIFLSFCWYLFCRKTAMPESWGARLAPVIFGFIYYAGLWAIAFGLSHYSYRGDAWNGFFILTLPYFLPNVYFSFSGSLNYFPVMQLIVTLVSLLTIVMTFRKRQPKAVIDKRAWALGMSMLAICIITGYQFYDRTTKIFSRDWEVERVSDEVYLDDYKPFRSDNILVSLAKEPSLKIDSDYPRLDGATAVYPIYGAMVQEIYQGLDERTVSSYVTCTRTTEAYERLINGEVDVFFGLQPSEQHLQMAAEQGLEFELLPIAKEAFVFFVNVENPVDALSVAEIQDIYTKKIKNWRKLGGADETILPFQRPENSGSQTIMLAEVMQGISLPEPLREEYVSGMGGIINNVATYRNYSASIGYSFRFYATGMNPNENIKLIAVNGVEPSVENIQTGAYPFTVNMYAVTVRPKSENTQKLLDWLVSKEGQELIELSGYVRQ